MQSKTYSCSLELATKRRLGSSRKGLLKWKHLCEMQLYVIIKSHWTVGY